VTKPLAVNVTRRVVTSAHGLLGVAKDLERTERIHLIDTVEDGNVDPHHNASLAANRAATADGSAAAYSVTSEKCHRAIDCHRKCSGDGHVDR